MAALAGCFPVFYFYLTELNFSDKKMSKFSHRTITSPYFQSKSVSNILHSSDQHHELLLSGTGTLDSVCVLQSAQWKGADCRGVCGVMFIPYLWALYFPERPTGRVFKKKLRSRQTFCGYAEKNNRSGLRVSQQFEKKKVLRRQSYINNWSLLDTHLRRNLEGKKESHMRV